MYGEGGGGVTKAPIIPIPGHPMVAQIVYQRSDVLERSVSGCLFYTRFNYDRFGLCPRVVVVRSNTYRYTLLNSLTYALNSEFFLSKLHINIKSYLLVVGLMKGKNNKKNFFWRVGLSKKNLYICIGRHESTSKSSFDSTERKFNAKGGYTFEFDNYIKCVIVKYKVYCGRERHEPYGRIWIGFSLVFIRNISILCSSMELLIN